MKQKITTTNATETQELAAKLAQQKESLQVITLTGDLGAGKTTFTQGFARALGITRRLISPTFIIMRTYNLPEDPKSQKKFFYHVDLYRLGGVEEVEDLGLREIMHDPQNIVAIEWPEKIATALPKKKLDLTLTAVDDNTREIIIEDTDGSTKD